MPTREVSQERLIECVRLRNQVRRLMLCARKCAECIFDDLDGGASVELGVHVVEVEEKTSGARRTRILLVDGKPLDEF